MTRRGQPAGWRAARDAFSGKYWLATAQANYAELMSGQQMVVSTGYDGKSVTYLQTDVPRLEFPVHSCCFNANLGSILAGVRCGLISGEVRDGWHSNGRCQCHVNPRVTPAFGTGPMFISTTSESRALSLRRPAACQPLRQSDILISPENPDAFFFSLAEVVWAISPSGPQNVIRHDMRGTRMPKVVRPDGKMPIPGANNRSGRHGRLSLGTGKQDVNPLTTYRPQPRSPHR